jgi:hypothetical protein
MLHVKNQEILIWSSLVNNLAYLRDWVEVDVDDLVQISGSNLGDLLQFLEVVRAVWLDEHVQSNRCQVANSNLNTNILKPHIQYFIALILPRRESCTR